jgi:hypothetical protein
MKSALDGAASNFASVIRELAKIKRHLDSLTPQQVYTKEEVTILDDLCDLCIDLECRIQDILDDYEFLVD